MFTTTRQQIANARDGIADRVVRDRLGPAALLFLIVIGFFWKITLTSQFTFLESPDQANQVLPWQQLQAAAFHRGQFPAWDPYLWGGQSLIGQAQPGTAYPLNWILYSLPLKTGTCTGPTSIGISRCCTCWRRGSATGCAATWDAAVWRLCLAGRRSPLPGLSGRFPGLKC